MSKHQGETIYFHELWKKFYTGKQLFMVIILFVLSCWGTWDSFRDVDGDRMLTILPIVAAGVFAIWQMLMLLRVKKERLSSSMMQKWFAFTALVGSLPLIIANVLFLIGAWFVPANRVLIETPNFHYWWEESIMMQIMLIGLIGYLAQGLGSVAMYLIVVLPVLSRKKTSIVVKGSDLEGAKDKKAQSKIASSIYISVAMFIVGTGIAGFTLGLFLESRTLSGIMQSIQKIWEQALWVISNIRYGLYDMEQIIWLIGILLMIIGVLSFIWDIIRMKRLKNKETEEANETDE